MTTTTPRTRIYWSDFVKVFDLIELYVEIEDKTCDQAKLAKVIAQANRNGWYDEPSSYIRFKVYPDYMSRINCTHGRHRIGADSPVCYMWDYPDADQFFHEMVMDRGMRATYKEIAHIMSGNKSKSKPKPKPKP